VAERGIGGIRERERHMEIKERAEEQMFKP
jgi:hypothetical protein